MAKKFDDEDGVWRTIGGRRIFIKDGEDLATAMKKSGKFKRIKDIEHQQRKINNELAGLTGKDKEIADEEYDAYEKLKKGETAPQKLSDREIKSIKTQKSLKALVEEGKATDITQYDDDQTRALDKKHGRLERIKVTSGTYGMNGALLQSNETGEYFVITSRNGNLFYWV